MLTRTGWKMDRNTYGRVFRHVTIKTLALVLLLGKLDASANESTLKNGALIVPDVLELQKIQVESIPRTYEAGPIDGSFALSIYDQILLTVEKNTPNTIWQWAMFTGDGIGEKSCELSKIYYLGYQVAFFCGRVEGVYRAYAKAKLVTDLNNDSSKALEKYSTPDMYGRQQEVCDEGKPCLEPFYLMENKLLTKSPLEYYTEIKNFTILSDPIKLKASEYCFQWGYALKVEQAVGYAYTDLSPHGEDGTYIRYTLILYVAAANSMAETEIVRTGAPKRFSGLLTKRFHAKGLEPCFRHAHQAIELISSPIYHPEKNYWAVQFKVHTDTIVSVLSDISFTVSSKQHMALYGCFIAETRIMISPRQFSFLKAKQYVKSTVNFAHSEIPEVLKRFLDTKVDEVYGREIEYVGRPWEPEQAKHRRDAQAFLNACVTREFGITVRGVAYIIQNWFKHDEDIQQMAVPDVVDLKLIDRRGKNYEFVPVPVHDMVWTPTHLVFLTAKSHIILHPSSVVYKGFGLIRETQSYRIGGLVNRRWCARTGTPKEHNMIVPAFSMNGNFVVIQILPTEETFTTWFPSPSTSCMGTEKIKKVPSNIGAGAKSFGKSGNSHLSDSEQLAKAKKEKSDQIVTDKLERCIHRKEVPKSENNIEEMTAVETEALEAECRTLLRDTEGKTEVTGTEEQLDSMLTFWFSGQALITENDPHFIKLDDQATLKQANPNSENYNSHILYEVDVTGQRLLRVLQAHGLRVVEIRAKFGSKHLFWVHDIQFTAVERSYIEAVEFKTGAIARVDFSMAIVNVVTLGQPIRIFPKDGNSIERLAAEFTFPGIILIRPKPTPPSPTKRSEGEPPNRRTKPRMNKLQGRIKLFTTNTAKSSYVLHLDYGEGNEARDLIFYATFDGGHARPLSYSDNPLVSTRKVIFTGAHAKIKDEKAKVLKADMVMTEHGMISVLWRKANTSDLPLQPEDRDHYPQAAIIGSVLVNEPLIKVMPFKGSSYLFQRITADDQIAYGEYDLNEWHTEEEDPVSTFDTRSLNLDEDNENPVPESILNNNDGGNRAKRDSSSIANALVKDQNINQNVTSNLLSQPLEQSQSQMYKEMRSGFPKIATASADEELHNLIGLLVSPKKVNIRNKAMTPPHLFRNTTHSALGITPPASTTATASSKSLVTTKVKESELKTPVTTKIEIPVLKTTKEPLTSSSTSPSITIPNTSDATNPEVSMKPTMETIFEPPVTDNNDSDNSSVTVPESEKTLTFVQLPNFAYPKANLKLLYVKNTRMLSIPYESLLAGNIDAAAVPPEMDDEPSYATAEICPYTDFVVHFLPFDFAEVEYRTRISAEIVYLGNAIPMEADILAEFDDVPGVSVELSTATEENRDQTLVRKIIDIRTYLTVERMEAMYKYASEHGDEDKILEDIRVFSITMRPSILNLHCPKNSLFKTLQINVGCNPFSRMRFIGEAAGLTKVPYVASTDDKDRETSWTLVKDGDDYIVTIPRSKVNFEQRKLFNCVKGARGKGGYCIVPKEYTQLFKDNIYSYHFTKKIVPSFEQFLTRHVRRVTGNIFIYNILGSPVKVNTTMLDSGCHNFGPLCAPTDESCLVEQNNTNLAKEFSWTDAFLQEAPSRSSQVDIYRYFRNCFDNQRRNEDGDTFWLKPGLPDRMSSESYRIFNSTNFNAFSLSKHRNMVFLMRAVGLNTPGNSFTFCQRLETFFLLHMTGVAPARLPLPWMTYLLLTVFVLLCFLLLYVIYRHSSYWKSEDFSRRLKEEEYREKRESEAERLQMKSNPENYGIWASRLRNLTLVKPEEIKKSN